ncbi:protein of unknown function [Streptococcus thermophilus]|nr:protein of unknown function [Streptococcus thermophilus]CAD0167368.1 protein of unknown function [Streptococcus thermophilus]CAD0169648.1 protein of unknown function [Streptococcus thermophilus]
MIFKPLYILKNVLKYKIFRKLSILYGIMEVFIAIKFVF